MAREHLSEKVLLGSVTADGSPIKFQMGDGKKSRPSLNSSLRNYLFYRGGRFWPKTGCDGGGQNCETGQSVSPCGRNGCDPPAETKVEFFFPPAGDRNNVWYDISLVDGYSLPVQIVPSVQQGSCVTTRCALSLNSCPTNENNVGDLRVIKNGRTVQCLAPCKSEWNQLSLRNLILQSFIYFSVKEWNYPAPFGLNRPESVYPGVQLCCPTPPIWPDQCRAGIVVQTQYVKLVHRDCPTAYAYAYDDDAGLHNCPNGVNFKVTFCP